VSCFSVCLLGLFVAVELPQWDFTSKDELSEWVPNAQLSNVTVADGILSADGADWDAFFLNRSVSFPATPYQYVVLRIRASRGGLAELFWSGSLEGEYGGLSGSKRVQFAIPDDQQWHELVVFPFWHTEQQIRQLRLDLYAGSHFEIDWIKGKSWDQEAKPTVRYSWTFTEDASSWQIHPECEEFFAPPVKLDVSERLWVTVRACANASSTAALLWATEQSAGLNQQSFSLRGDGKWHTYNLDMAGIKTWKSPVVALGIRLPKAEGVALESISIQETPAGDADPIVTYFGFVDAPNRAQTVRRVMLRVANHGGADAVLASGSLHLPSDMKLVADTDISFPVKIAFGEYVDLVWQLEAARAGVYPVTANLEGTNMPEDIKTTLRFEDAIQVSPSDYVPPPQPVPTSVKVCTYYFPGWDTPAKWDCIREVAPNRKPGLGYYDEGNPECVDWQIKWAVENGISCFLVDWYWQQGTQHLTHWFEAYRKARYRDYLNVAIMWANHNAPDTHSADDWRAVTKEWIERYFSLPSYFRIDGKPAVFIWNPNGLRSDLEKRSESVRDCLAESQRMARDAGYEGITFVAMGYDFSGAQMNRLREEGYKGLTTYHEWGAAVDSAFAARRMSFEQVVRLAPTAWERINTSAGDLTYYPVVDTGWDSRPWHGDNSLVIEGRSPELFEALLRAAKAFCETHKKDLVVLGPWNEWGEGSYIEPCTEFGFDMLERVRTVFAACSPDTFPTNIAPCDVGRGPYDFPPRQPKTAWTFEHDSEGWAAIMNTQGLRAEAGTLRFRTLSSDAALITRLDQISAEDFSGVHLRMSVAPSVPTSKATGQVFWSLGGAELSEASSVTFEVLPDGEMHDYNVVLQGNPRWRGRIASLRFDPCDLAQADVVIDEIGFLRQDK